MSSYTFIHFQQPGGDFLLTIIPASELLDNYSIKRRRYTGDKSEGTQRTLRKERVEKIADYCNTVDASFPTSMILTVQEDNYEIDENKITINSPFEVIDGQHRIEGLKRAREKYGQGCIAKFDLPCVIIPEVTEEQKAYLFATINGEQVKVPKSFVYDLFGVSEYDDPYSILHTTARKLNFNTESPFYRRLKMLGSKSIDVETESLTQGTFIKEIIGKISSDPLKDRDIIKTKGYEYLDSNPNLVLRPYLIKGGADYLYHLFRVIFNAVRDTWPNEWEDFKTFILSKTTGYVGIVKAIDPVLEYGLENGILTEDLFKLLFSKTKELIEEDQKTLTNDHFASGSVGQNSMKKYIENAWALVQIENKEDLEEIIEKEA